MLLPVFISLLPQSFPCPISNPAEFDFEALVLGLAAAPHEAEKLEFKQNRADPVEIGQYISALSNSAALHGESHAFLVWGIEDETHNVVGTTFDPAATRKGNELLESYISHMLTPRIDFRFYTGLARGLPVVVLEIPAAIYTPTRFSGEEYIRVGSTTKKLKDYPDKQRKLWARLTRVTFEEGSARHGLTTADVLSMLDISDYFELSGNPIPTTPERIIERLIEEGFVVRSLDGSLAITNLGGITFGKPLRRLRLDRKAVRVVVYSGTNKLDRVRQQEGGRGYIAGFAGLIDYIMTQIPSSEVISQTLRTDVPLYPGQAIRELVANALIHQDFSVTGSGPLVEIFDGRIEISNPGSPLVDLARILDTARSRNEKLAATMRRFRYAEELGSGIDRVVTLAEGYQLPAPDFQVSEDRFTAILYAPRPLGAMTRDDRIRACYQHACLRWVARTQLTNASLRGRFGISEANSAMASRIIAETEAVNLIKKHNPESWSRKHARYIPFWA